MTSMRNPVRWALGKRTIGWMENGEWVDAPQRTERTWAWLTARIAPPRTSPRRITVVAYIAIWWTLIALGDHLDAWASPYRHGIRAVLGWVDVGFLAAGAGLLVVMFGYGIRRKRRRS